MLIGIAQSALRRSLFEAQMVELAAGGLQSVADLAQTARLSQLAKQHRHELGPAGEAFSVALSPGLPHQALEVGAGDDLKDLGEQTQTIPHGRGSLLADRCFWQSHHSTSLSPCPITYSDT